MTLSETISQFAVNARYEDLDESQITSAKGAISDCMGCAIAGSAEELGVIIQKVARASSSAGQSTMLGSKGLVSAQAAALSNGTSAHALDFDDILWSMYGHPSTVVCPAAWAIAELTQATGKDLILAFAILGLMQHIIPQCRYRLLTHRNRLKKISAPNRKNYFSYILKGKLFVVIFIRNNF